MKIDSVNIINLERREDLKAAQLENWRKVGFDDSEIIFHTAKDGLSYDSRESLIDAARADGFFWFINYFKEQGYDMGLGELACMWSIARLLRYIRNQAACDKIFLYCLADRYSKKHRSELESIFQCLPNLKFFQFRGYVPKAHEEKYQGMLHWINKRPAMNRVSHPNLPPNEIEENGLKLGDGILAMTPEGARWMQSVCEPRLPETPYEVILYMYGCQPYVSWMFSGVYSALDALDLRYDEAQFYAHGIYTNQWEAQYDYNSSLGESDIAKVNRFTKTGEYGHEEWRKD